MTIQTVRAPNGKVEHAVRSEAMQLSAYVFMVTTYCEKEMSGPLTPADGPDDVTCPVCEKAVRAMVARELTRLNEEMAVYGEPKVVPIRPIAAEEDDL